MDKEKVKNFLEYMQDIKAVKQLNVAAGVFECEISAITRQFEMTPEQYKNKYLGRW